MSSRYMLTLHACQQQCSTGDRGTRLSVFLFARAVLLSHEHTTLTSACVSGYKAEGLRSLFDLDSRHVMCHTFPHA